MRRTYSRLEKSLFYAFYIGSEEKVRAIIEKNPQILDKPSSKWDTWLKKAVGSKNLEIVKYFISKGCDVNSQTESPDKTTPLDAAIGFEENYEIAKLLLENGADPNLSRPVISAMNSEDESLRLPFIKLLVKHGLNVNQLYDLYGNWDNAFTALDWAIKPEIISYLKQHGAKTAEELKAGTSTTKVRASKKKKKCSPRGEVIAFFEKEFGTVEKNSITETLPTGSPVEVHLIKPKGKRKHFTLFTTGLSIELMNVPTGEEYWSFAELYIQLPGNWKIDQLSVPRWNWPILWLQQIAQYPRVNNTWLGDGFTIIANNEPPEPLASNTDLSCLLLLANKSLNRTDGNEVQLYQILPIHKEERDLEIQKGAPALMQAFDRASVPFIVDTKRPSVV